MTRIQLNFKEDEEHPSFSEQEKSAIEAAAKDLQRVVNSEAFRLGVVRYSFKPKVGRRKYYFRMNKGKSRQEIYKMLITGQDNYETKRDYTLNFLVKPFERKFDAQGGTAGFTRPDTQFIFLNKAYLTYYIHNYPSAVYLPSFAGTLLHEYCHNLGFSHRGNRSSAYNQKTVPYAVGNLVVKLLREIQEEEFEFTEEVVANLEEKFSLERFCA